MPDKNMTSPTKPMIGSATDIPPEFKPFGKIPRLNREVWATEKLDGTNGLVHITPDGDVFAGSRTRWVTPEQDNYGFAAWVKENEDGLRNLGPGSHYGEWWGRGIQRNYGLKERKFSLFNTARWLDPEPRLACVLPEYSHLWPNPVRLPDCCDLVPVLFRGNYADLNVNELLENLRIYGSVAAKQFPHPEGIILYHVAGGHYYKVTLEKDAEPKGRLNGA